MTPTVPKSEAAEQDAREEISRLLAEIREAMKPPIVRYLEKTPGEELRAEIVAQQQLQNVALPSGPGFAIAYEPGEFLAELRGRLDRLAFLLGLSDGERAFVKAAADAPTDHVNLQVFADWLEEAGRPEEAASVRRITPEDGSLLVLRYDGSKHQDFVAEINAEQIRGPLEKLGRKVAVVPLKDSFDVSHLSPQDGDVLVFTYPRLCPTRVVQDIIGDAKGMREGLARLGRKVYVAVVPEDRKIEMKHLVGKELMTLTLHDAILDEVRRALTAPLDTDFVASGYAMPYAQEVLKLRRLHREEMATLTAEAARTSGPNVLADRVRSALATGTRIFRGDESPEARMAIEAAAKLHDDNLALKAELAELLREKRERGR